MTTHPGTFPNQSSSRVLVVDDHRDSAEILVMLLGRDGHEVLVAHSGPEAIEQARSRRPGVILLDIGLPEMDGYEVARRLRQDGACEHCLIIAVSGHGREEDRSRCREAGIDAHLLKPFDYRALKGVMSTASRGGDPEAEEQPRSPVS